MQARQLAAQIRKWPIGLPIPELDPWIVRPALTARVAWIPGVPLACGRDEVAYTCGQSGPSDLVLYAVGRAVVPGAELTVARLERTRRFAVGFGVQARLERAFGQLPTGGEAQMLSDGSAVRYTVEPEQRAFAATGWSAMATVLLAL